MSVTLQRFANPDTNYVAKHNANADALEVALDSIDAILGGVTGAGALTIAAAYEALFGATVALVGSGSFAQSTAGTILTVQAGYCWRPSLNQILYRSSSTGIDFTGVTAGTYYIQVDAGSNPIRTTDSTEAIYTVVWSGSAFTSVTRSANIVWSSGDWIAAQASAALAASYDGLDARLEAGETKAVAGDLARTYVKGRLSKNVAGGADVALTDVEANNIILSLTGALTANINVTVNQATSPRMWFVENNTTGAFTLTFKGTTGTGVVVPQGSTAIVYSNNTNMLPALVSDTDPTLAANSDLRHATQKAVKAYVDGLVGGSTHPYDLAGAYVGQPAAGVVMMRYKFPRTVVFASGLAPSQGVAVTAATAQTDFDIQKNASSVGTMRFAAAGTAATFIMASATTFVAGDILTLVAPGTPDATLADIAWTLSGTR
jgi:hypothetical protein